MRGTTSNLNIHNNEKRKLSFNAIAHLYDKYRPGYPKNLFEFLKTKASLQKNSRILEIGCGSGQATLGFSHLNVKITAIDRSSELLKIARSKFSHLLNITLKETSFENFQCDDSQFNLIFAAQTFHWIDFEKGLSKCEKLLNKNGGGGIILEQ